MNVGERLIALRESLKMNQTDFGARASMPRSTIAAFEAGTRDMKDIHVAQICAAFHVNEAWLRTGDGDMFVACDESILGRLAEAYRLDALELAFMRTYLSLSDEYRAMARVFLASLADNLARATIDETAELRAEVDAIIDAHEAEMEGRKDA